MMKLPRGSKTLAIKKMQEIVDRAVDISADAVTIEFAREGGLEVFFAVGDTGFGGILVDRTLEAAIMTLIQRERGCRKDHTVRCTGNPRDRILRSESRNMTVSVRPHIH